MFTKEALVVWSELAAKVVERVAAAAAILEFDIRHVAMLLIVMPCVTVTPVEFFADRLRFCSALTDATQLERFLIVMSCERFVMAVWVSLDNDTAVLSPTDELDEVFCFANAVNAVALVACNCASVEVEIFDCNTFVISAVCENVPPVLPSRLTFAFCDVDVEAADEFEFVVIDCMIALQMDVLLIFDEATLVDAPMVTEIGHLQTVV